MGMEEQILAEGCRKGDNAARRELYDRYAGRLLAVCLRYSGDRSTAEDLMHDAFLKIYGAFDRFSYRGPGSLRAWMERITVNVALEWLRSRNKLSMTVLDDGEERRLLLGLLRVAVVGDEQRLILRDDERRVIAAEAAEVMKIHVFCHDDCVEPLLLQQGAQCGQTVFIQRIIPLI